MKSITLQNENVMLTWWAFVVGYYRSRCSNLTFYESQHMSNVEHMGLQQTILYLFTLTLNALQNSEELSHKLFLYLTKKHHS